MIKHYKKQPKPEWQQRILVFLGFLFGATLLLFLAWAVVLFIE